MKNWMSLVLALFLVLPAARAEQGEHEPLTLTLDQALQLAKEKSVDLTLARLTLEEFHSRYRQALGNALPDITVSGMYTRNFIHPVAFFSGGKVEMGIDNAYSGAIDLQQPLYTGGKVLTGIRAAKHALQSGEKQLQSTEEDVTLTVKSIFYNVLLASATVGIEQDNLASAQDHLNTIQARYRQGLDSDLTLRRQQVEVANAKAVLIGARNTHEMALIGLQEVLKLDVDRPLQIIGILEPPRHEGPSYEEVSHLAVQRHPGLQASRELTQFYSQLIHMSISDMKPQLSLFGHYDWTAQANDLSPRAAEQGTSFAGGAKLSYAFFTGGDLLERVRQARFAYERSREETDQLERAVRVDVRRRWLAIAEALERAKSQEEAMDQARLALKATEVRYRSGQANQLELNDATFALNRVRTLSIQAAHDYWVSLAALERATGASLKEVKP